MFGQNRTHDQVTSCCIFATLGHKSCNFQIRLMHQKWVKPQSFIAITNAYINNNSQHRQSNYTVTKHSSLPQFDLLKIWRVIIPVAVTFLIETQPNITLFTGCVCISGFTKGATTMLQKFIWQVPSAIMTNIIWLYWSERFWRVNFYIFFTSFASLPHRNIFHDQRRCHSSLKSTMAQYLLLGRTTCSTMLAVKQPTLNQPGCYSVLEQIHIPTLGSHVIGVFGNEWI